MKKMRFKTCLNKEKAPKEFTRSQTRAAHVPIELVNKTTSVTKTTVFNIRMQKGHFALHFIPLGLWVCGVNHISKNLQIAGHRMQKSPRGYAVQITGQVLLLTSHVKSLLSLE